AKQSNKKETKIHEKEIKTFVNQQNTLVYTYYLGMIFTGATSAQKRLLRELVTPHYYITALRVYDIFVVVGMAQIYRTAIVIYYDIQDLRVAEVRQIIDNSS
ncbi:23780_t:CDS:1, partial [Racocetra persica]